MYKRQGHAQAQQQHRGRRERGVGQDVLATLGTQRYTRVRSSDKGGSSGKGGKSGKEKRAERMRKKAKANPSAAVIEE